MKENKWNNESNPHHKKFTTKDLDEGPIVNDSEFGPVIHVSAFHCIAPDGTHIYEW